MWNGFTAEPSDGGNDCTQNPEIVCTSGADSFPVKANFKCNHGKMNLSGDIGKSKQNQSFLFRS
jgi:hypothetical protein